MSMIIIIIIFIIIIIVSSSSSSGWHQHRCWTAAAADRRAQKINVRNPYMMRPREIYRNYINELCQNIYWRKNEINLLLTNNEFMMGIDNKYFFPRPPFLYRGDEMMCPSIMK